MAASRNWTLAEAWAAQVTFGAAGGELADPCSPFSQWVALRRLDQLERDFNGGDESSIPTALAECARAGLVMPDWLASAYLAAYRHINHRRAVSWDDVLGSPLPDGGVRKLGELRRQR